MKSIPDKSRHPLSFLLTLARSSHDTWLITPQMHCGLPPFSNKVQSPSQLPNETYSCLIQRQHWLASIFLNKDFSTCPIYPITNVQQRIHQQTSDLGYFQFTAEPLINHFSTFLLLANKACQQSELDMLEKKDIVPILCLSLSYSLREGEIALLGLLTVCWTGNTLHWETVKLFTAVTTIHLNSEDHFWVTCIFCLLIFCLLPWPHQASTEMTALIFALSGFVPDQHRGSASPSTRNPSPSVILQAQIDSYL